MIDILNKRIVYVDKNEQKRKVQDYKLLALKRGQYI